MVDDLHHIFLIHHDTIRFAKMLLKYWMQIRITIRLVKSLYVLTHHARLRYARTYDRTGGDEMDIIIASQLDVYKRQTLPCLVLWNLNIHLQMSKKLLNLLKIIHNS